MVDITANGIALHASGSTTANPWVLSGIPDNAVSVVEVDYSPNYAGTRIYHQFRDASNNNLYVYYHRVKFASTFSRDAYAAYSSTGTVGLLTDTPTSSIDPKEGQYHGIQAVVYNYGTAGMATVDWQSFFNEGSDVSGRQSRTIFRIKDNSNSGFEPVNGIYFQKDNSSSGSTLTFQYRIYKIRDIVF